MSPKNRPKPIGHVFKVSHWDLPLHRMWINGMIVIVTCCVLFIILAVGSLPSAAQMEPPGSGLDWWRINNINNMKLDPGPPFPDSGRRLLDKTKPSEGPGGVATPTDPYWLPPVPQVSSLDELRRMIKY
ncbi:MAG: hypothetical protein ACLQPD_28140 [Desulfomonilaceae bacterium]